MLNETPHSQNSNDVGTVAECTNGFPLVLLGKRGWNSLLASWLAEFLLRKGQLVHCLDGDPLNRSLSQYRSLGVEKLELINAEGVVQCDRYDALVEHLTSKGGIFVVDNGATAFLLFRTHLVEGEIIRELRDAGRRALVQVPIAGGEMLSDTLLGLKILARSIALRNLVPWINAGIDCAFAKPIHRGINQWAGPRLTLLRRDHARLRPAGLRRLTRLNNTTRLPSSS